MEPGKHCAISRLRGQSVGWNRWCISLPVDVAERGEEKMTASLNETCSLTQRHCVPCEGGVAALEGDGLDKMVRELKGDWLLMDGLRIAKPYKFKDFKSAMAFAVEVGEIAEAEGHHPELCVGWGKVKVELWTHAAGGLTENDFIVAAKIDERRSGRP